MFFSLIICTYQRSGSLKNLLNSRLSQSVMPNEILIIDGSLDDATKDLIRQYHFDELSYYRVDHLNRGLTKQRNFGVSKLNPGSQIVCFLDDDVILDMQYFEILISTYRNRPHAIGVGGFISNQVEWKPSKITKSKKLFYFDGYSRVNPSRYFIREFIGLGPNRPPCFLPNFGHGRSVGFLPPSGKVYPVEHFLGGVSSYRTKVFSAIKFSEYFEGYGLYEDADFCFRLNQLGSLYVNTAARLEHHHAPSGRPNLYKYGQMVIRNGWYVWRVRYPNPAIQSRFKWRACSLLLVLMTFARFDKNGLKEGLGRLFAWLTLFFNKPVIQS